MIEWSLGQVNPIIFPILISVRFDDGFIFFDLSGFNMLSIGNSDF